MNVDITEQFVRFYDLHHLTYNPKGEDMATKKQSTIATVAEEPTLDTVAGGSAETVLIDIPVPEPQVIRKFDPLSKLIKVKGGQLYLQVRDRLIWLREEHPEAQISTHLQDYYPENQMWVVKAEIVIWVLTDINGSYQEARGSGLGQETEKDFPAGALEKAETKAIGRALATLGYGTQFALEMDEGNLADTPVTRRTQPHGKILAAGVPELKADILAMLEVDTDGAAKLPKHPDDMNEGELAKTAEWLRLRANR